MDEYTIVDESGKKVRVRLPKGTKPTSDTLEAAYRKQQRDAEIAAWNAGTAKLRPLPLPPSPGMGELRKSEDQRRVSGMAAIRKSDEEQARRSAKRAAETRRGVSGMGAIRKSEDHARRVAFVQAMERTRKRLDPSADVREIRDRNPMIPFEDAKKLKQTVSDVTTVALDAVPSILGSALLSRFGPAGSMLGGMAAPVLVRRLADITPGLGPESYADFDRDLERIRKQNPYGSQVVQGAMGFLTGRPGDTVKAMLMGAGASGAVSTASQWLFNPKHEIDPLAVAIDSAFGAAQTRNTRLGQGLEDIGDAARRGTIAGARRFGDRTIQSVPGASWRAALALHHLGNAPNAPLSPEAAARIRLSEPHPTVLATPQRAIDRGRGNAEPVVGERAAAHREGSGQPLGARSGVAPRGDMSIRERPGRPMQPDRPVQTDVSVRHREALAESERAGRSWAEEVIGEALQSGRTVDEVLAERSARMRRGDDSPPQRPHLSETADIPRRRPGESVESAGGRRAGNPMLDALQQAARRFRLPAAAHAPIEGLSGRRIGGPTGAAPPLLPPPPILLPPGAVRVEAPVGGGRGPGRGAGFGLPPQEGRSAGVSPHAEGSRGPQSVTLRVDGQDFAFDLNAHQQARWQEASETYQARREAALSIENRKERGQTLRNLRNQFAAQKQRIVLDDGPPTAAVGGAPPVPPPSRPPSRAAAAGDEARTPFAGSQRPPVRTTAPSPFPPDLFPIPEIGTGRFSPIRERNPQIDRMLGLNQPDAVLPTNSLASVLPSIHSASSTRTGEIIKERFSEKMHRFLATEEQKIPGGAKVSEAFVVPKGELEAVIRETLSIIDGVHADGELPKIPIEKSLAMRKYGAKYSSLKSEIPGEKNRAYRILLSKFSELPRLDLCHEIGHVINEQAWPGKELASDVPQNIHFEKWVHEVKNSTPIIDLENHRDSGQIEVFWSDGSMDYEPADVNYINYLLDPDEIWARCYAQYIATRSGQRKLTGHSELIRELHEERKSVKNRPYYPKQWSDKEFEPIMAAMDAIFKEKGWL